VAGPSLLHATAATPLRKALGDSTPLSVSTVRPAIFNNPINNLPTTISSNGSISMI
jgi:hypothetical protein